MTEMRRRMEEELKLQGYSPRTNKTYLSWVARFAKHYHRSPEQLGSEQIRAFLVDLLEQNNLSRSSLTQAFCALKFFYVHVLHLHDVEAVRDEVRRMEHLAIRAFGSKEAVAALDRPEPPGRRDEGPS